MPVAKRVQMYRDKALIIREEIKPVSKHISPWNFFPDMSATTVDECEFVFERHFLTKKQVSELKDMEDVDLDALRQRDAARAIDAIARDIERRG